LAPTILAVAASLLAGGSVSAQEGSDMPMKDSSEFMIGLGVAHGAAYLGSDEHRTRAIPVLAARWSNGWSAGIGGFAGTGGVFYRFASSTPWSYGLRLTVDFGRDEDDGDALRGMGDIEARPELGGFVSYALLPGLRLGAAVRYGSGNDRDGLLGEFSVRGIVPLSPGVRLTAGLMATLANAQAMQSQFGVDAGQSLRSGYAIYTPRSGLRNVDLQIGSMFDLGSNAVLMVGLTGRSLMSDAVDSPLTRERSSLGALASLSYRF
jgi:outer membrane scaffolding protein for murein synthesis (MipA/OmpV family)